MLAQTAKCGARRSRRGGLAVGLITLGALALPTLTWSTAPRAGAQEEQRGDSQPAATDATKSKDAAAADAPLGGTSPARASDAAAAADNPFGGDLPKEKSAGDPFGAGPRVRGAYRPAAVEYLPEQSAREKKILFALATPTTFDFQETPLRDAMLYFAANYKEGAGPDDVLDIVLDAKALSDAGGADQPLTLSMKKVPLKSALKLLLKPLDLTYVIRDDVLVITTDDAASAEMIVRTYPVGDLVAGADDEKAYESLVQAITGAVDGASWQESGGNGQLKVVPSARSLVVSQYFGAHEKILELLRALRLAKSKQSAGGDPTPAARGAEVSPATDRTSSRDPQVWSMLGLELAPAPVEQFSPTETRFRGGLVVTRVRQDGPASRQGVNRGDVLVGLGSWETKRLEDVKHVLGGPTKVAENDKLKFYLLRGSETLYGHLSLAASPAAADPAR